MVQNLEVSPKKTVFVVLLRVVVRVESVDESIEEEEWFETVVTHKTNSVCFSVSDSAMALQISMSDSGTEHDPCLHFYVIYIFFSFLIFVLNL